MSGVSGRAKGLDLFIDLDLIDDRAAERTKRRLQELLTALEGRAKPT